MLERMAINHKTKSQCMVFVEIRLDSFDYNVAEKEGREISRLKAKWKIAETKCGRAEYQCEDVSVSNRLCLLFSVSPFAFQKPAREEECNDVIEWGSEFPRISLEELV